MGTNREIKRRQQAAKNAHHAPSGTGLPARSAPQGSSGERADHVANDACRFLRAGSVDRDRATGPSDRLQSGYWHRRTMGDGGRGTGELNGRIAKILVKEGEQVHKGQTVAELENEDL